MLLRQISSGHMVEVHNLFDLMNLNCTSVTGQCQEGEEEQDPESFDKADLHFLSGEELPRCWTDPHYRDSELER